MRTIKQSTVYDLTVFMTDSADHLAGKTGLTLTITASKAGAAFAAITPTVTELATGWYKLALTTSHTDTVGDLALHITGSGADPSDLAIQVRANVLGDTLPANATQLAGQTVSAAAGVTFPSSVASPTNITAGTITTVTNLTNSPTAGDLTATMKTSVTTAATAATPSIAGLASGVGAVPGFGIVDRGTAQSAGATSLVLRAAAALGDDAVIGATGVITGGTLGVGQTFTITDYVGSTDTVTHGGYSGGVTPTGTITYEIYATAPSAAGGGLDAAGVRAAVGLASANLDTQLAAIDDLVDTEVGAIKTKTDFLPSATAGAAGGIFIAGSNAATTVNFTGNLSGSVGSVGAGGITAASLASDTITAAKIATDAITAAKIAADAFTAAKFAADVTTEFQTGLSTAAALATVNALVDTLETSAAAIKVVTDNLATAIELDGAVYRYTANALEQAPSGTGASAASIRAEMDSNSTKLASIDAKTTNLPTDPADQSLVIAATDAVTAAIAALNNLSSAQAQTAAAAALTAYDPPTTAEMDARTLPTASYATASALDTVDNLIDTEIAALAAAVAALNNLSTAQVRTEVDAALDATVADSIPADGTRPSVRQGIYMNTQYLLERGVSGTTLTVRKADGATALMTLTLNDAATPTSVTRAT